MLEKTRSAVVRQDIQGLRAIAVLSVIIFHANKDWLPGGFVGVDVFFVISGFLITSIILEQQSSGKFSFLSFYFSRAKRIIPAYLVLLVVAALVFSILLIPADYVRFGESLWSAVWFSSNMFFSKQADYFAPTGYETPLIHTWSLAVEMQFYLFLPLLLAWTPVRIMRIVIPLVIIAGVAYSTHRLNLGARQSEYYSLIARSPEFLLGGFLAAVPSTGRIPRLVREGMSTTGLILVVASCVFISEKSPLPGWLVLFPAFGAFLVLAGRGAAVTGVLSNPALCRIGDLSYSLYLWHWPILAALRYYGGTYHLSSDALLLFVVLTIGFSYASYRYVEAPFRRQKMGRGACRGFTSLAVFTGLLTWASGAINPAIVPSMHIALTRYASQEDICHGQVVGDCLRGDSSAKRQIVMLGDSHAAQLNYFADELGRGAKVGIRVISASNCVTIPGFDWNRIPEYSQGACKAQIDFVQKYTQSTDTILVAGMWQYQTKSERFMEALEEFIKMAEGRHQKIIVLAQVPMLTANVQRIYRYEILGIGGGGQVVHPEWHSANEKIKSIVAKYPNAIYVDFSSDKLFSTPPFYRGELIYHDDHHLNEVGARVYGEHAAQSQFFLKALNVIQSDNDTYVPNK